MKKARGSGAASILRQRTLPRRKGGGPQVGHQCPRAIRSKPAKAGPGWSSYKPATILLPSPRWRAMLASIAASVPGARKDHHVASHHHRVKARRQPRRRRRSHRPSRPRPIRRRSSLRRAAASMTGPPPPRRPGGSARQPPGRYRGQRRARWTVPNHSTKSVSSTARCGFTWSFGRRASFRGYPTPIARRAVPQALVRMCYNG